MNRGRFIGLTSLPVLFLGAPTYASDANATAPLTAPPAVVDSTWAERWKAAAAERAARQVRANAGAGARSAAQGNGVAEAPSSPHRAPAADDWAARWKAASDALEAKKAANREARRTRQPAPVRPPAPASPANPAAAMKLADGSAAVQGAPFWSAPVSTPVVTADGDVPAVAMERAQMLAMAQRRPRRPQPAAAPAEGAAEAAPPAAAEGEAPAAEPDAETRSPATGADPAGAAPPSDAAAADAAVTTEESAAPASPDDELVPIEDFEPFGYNRPLYGRSRNEAEETDFGGRNRRVPQADFFPLPDRFRVGLPGDYVQNVRGRAIDPYNQNVLKGDYPIIDRGGHHDDFFLILTLTSDTLFEARNLPVPTSVSASEEGEFGFFDDAGEQQLINQNFVATVEFFEGNTVYKPRDFEFRATVVGNINYLHANQTQVANIDFREGEDRFDEELAFQELFFEKHLMDLSANYDVLALRVGIQGFNSDFRGFLFSDNLPGVRLFGNYDNNRWQYNLAYFRQVEKDTNSGLNEFNDRNQNIFVANLFRQDFIVPGYTAQLSFHYNNDHSSNELQFDRNGFLVRPSPVGTIGTNEVDVFYLGWAGDGSFGRINLTHQFYQAFGRESDNAIAGREVDVNAQFAALELSYDVDYIRYRGSFLYASGDDDPTDGDANGFDSIFDNPNFAGGGINYFIRQPVRLTGSGIGLKQRLSLLPNLRTSKEQGQANFVNPGLMLFNLGTDVELTPKVKLIANASYLRFVDSSSMELVLQDNQIDEEIGVDLSVGAIYRPFLNNNVIITAGAAALLPGQGFEDLYTNETLYSFFTAITLTY